MKTVATLFLAVLISFSFDSIAQDPELTQFYASPLYLNPALAGTGSCDGGGRVALNYRNQWPSLPGTFVTTTASYDQHFDDIGGGIGFLLLDDRAGEGLLRSTVASAVYSYQLDVTQRFTIRFGMQGSVGQRSIDWYKLRFEDQIDPVQGFVLPTGEVPITDPVTYANFATGMVAYTEKFYGGFAVHNLIEPNESFYDNQAVIPRRYTAHAGMVIPLDGRVRPESTLSPNVLFMRQNKFSQLNVGFYYNKGPLVTGLWFRQTLGEYRNPDAMMALVGFTKDRFKFGYSYDFTVSDARTAAPGSHEISASIEWCARQPSRKFRNIGCPKF